LDRFDLQSLKAERLFRCAEGTYELPVGLAPGPSPESPPRYLTRRESISEPPNYLLYTVGQPAAVPLTHFTDPTPSVRQITKTLVTYERPDGVKLSFTLYLPPNHRAGERLPTLVWAYPQEFNDSSTAGQVSGSANRFTRLTGPTHLFFALHGYAVLDGATMPVVNLVAHSDLFRAAIARSGAYNRTLTPFGFQNERRTLWEAPEIYLKVSPFLYAHKVKAPVLLIHGDADNNPGTFPIQSERLYHALRGTGGHVRFVSLPHESHGYAAKESVEHTLAEMLEWCDRYVKNGAP
jgi:dipeptidyl aminopeptidase/acylaminoacyl peptidase